MHVKVVNIFDIMDGDKMKKLTKSFKYAFAGIISAFKSERNMKIHFIIMMIVIVLGFVYKISVNEWKECIFCFGLVIGTEMINTAIEVNTDLAMPNISDKAKIAKDISAGAVLVIAIMSVVIGLIIFLPKIMLSL